jgi:exodeoxyribonuclease VII large subunit
VSTQQERLQGLATWLATALRPSVPRRHDELQQRAQRLHRSVRAPLDMARARLLAQADRLQSLDPHACSGAVSSVEDRRARPVVSVTALQPQDQVRAVWADGAAQVRIEHIELANREAGPT